MSTLGSRKLAVKLKHFEYAFLNVHKSYNPIISILAENAPTENPLNETTEDPLATENDTDELYFDQENELRVNYLVEELLIAKLAVENDTELYKMGHKFYDLVFDCNFKGDDCR